MGKVKVHGWNWKKRGKRWWDFAIGGVLAKGKTKAIALKRARQKLPRGAKITEYTGIFKKSAPISTLFRKMKKRRRR